MQEIKEFNEFKGIFKEMRPFLSQDTAVLE
jgi:hypothetical protein